MREFSLQRFHLPNPAAKIRIARPEFGSVSLSLFLWRQRGKHPLYFNSVALLYLLDQPVSFWKEERRIENEDAQTRPDTRGNVDHHNSLGSESRRNGHILAEGLISPMQNLLGGP